MRHVEEQENPDRCLPKAKAQSLSQSERATTARKKKKAGARGQQVVSNTLKPRLERQGLVVRYAQTTEVVVQ